jgi:hypothetical protein
VPDDLTSDAELDRRLRHAVGALAAPTGPADPAGVTASVVHRVARRRRRTRLAAAAAGVVVVVGVTAGAFAAVGNGGSPMRSEAGPSAPVAPRPTRNGPSNTFGPVHSSPSNGAQAPGAGPVSCPPRSTAPTLVGGELCGPPPPAGNGFGVDGECTGRETTPPCGPGVVPGRYYAYTVPGSCTGLVIFDGRRWVSELPPPSPVAPFPVWMRLDTSGQMLGSIGPDGAVGYVPDTGQPLDACQAPPTTEAHP